MKLTNPIKKQLALDIVTAAAKKHAEALKGTASKLHDLWREAYKAHFITWVPGIPESAWAELIQEDVLRSVSQQGTLQVAKYEPLEGYHYRTTVDTIDIREPYSAQPSDRLQNLVAHVKTAFSGLCMLDAYGRDRYIQVRVNPSAGCYDIPAAGCVDRLDLRLADPAHANDPNATPTPYLKSWFNLAHPLYKQTLEIGRLYLKVFTEAERYHGELTQALAAISSRAQLLELFPEAEQFLPEPPPKPSKIVPANLFSNARKMLEEGIPN